MEKHIIAEFTKTRNRYRILKEDSEMKDPGTRQWIPAVIYQEYRHWNNALGDYDPPIEGGKVYVREKSDFIEKFDLVLDL